MPKTYATRKCYTCGKQVSTNGLAQGSHKKKHVREGLLVEMDVFYGYDSTAYSKSEYVSPKEARRLLDNATDYRTRVVSGTPAPKETP